MNEQNLAVMLYLNAPSNPTSIPGVWPYQVVELGISTTPPDNSGNWLIMTEDQYNMYVATNQPTYNAWNAPIVAAQLAAQTLLSSVQQEMVYGAQILAQLRAYIAPMGTTQVLTILQAMISNGGGVISMLQVGALAQANTLLLAITNMPFLDTPYSSSNPSGPTVRQYFSALILSCVC